MATIHPQSEERLLPVDLTTDEAAEAAQDLALAVKEHDDYKDTLDDWLDDMKRAKKAKTANLDSLAGDVSRLAHKVTDGKEERSVPCDWLYALGSGMAFLVRRDTEELIQKRRLMDDERQIVLGEVLQEPTPEQLAKWGPMYDFGNEGEGVVLPESDAGEDEEGDEG
jgi:hypothetical protein